jgi:hypothetical protein
MAKHKSTSQFAICINTNDADMLTPRMIYKIIRDENAAKSNYLRVIDNEGEDYLYPADYFVHVSFPQAIEKALVRLSPSASPRRQRRASPTHNRKVRASAA